jgi:hypothetical protein
LMACKASLLRRRGSFETWKSTKGWAKKRREIVWKKLFFYWTVLHIQFYLAWQLMKILQTSCIWCWTCRDSQHVDLAPSRYTICNTLHKKFTRKKSTRIKARNKCPGSTAIHRMDNSSPPIYCGVVTCG